MTEHEEIIARLKELAQDLGHPYSGDAAPPPPPPTVRPYFTTADWHWAPIASPSVDPNSAAIVRELANGKHIANLVEFGVTLRVADSTTPRYRVSFAYAGEWGPHPFGSDTVPIPKGTPVPPGSDGHLCIVDPARNAVYSFWQARYNAGGDTWSAGWGAKVALDGDGRETLGSSTGAGISRYACVIRASEIAAGDIPHALFFSTNMAARRVFRFPATKTDGANMAGVATPIPEGARVQLDPHIDVDALPGITRGERTVARALQRYGAYCGDNGGARMAFLFEYTTSDAYRKAGLGWDYFDMTHIPWSRLRVDG